jgi:hypothetical protein
LSGASTLAIEQLLYFLYPSLASLLAALSGVSSMSAAPEHEKINLDAGLHTDDLFSFAIVLNPFTKSCYGQEQW